MSNFATVWIESCTLECETFMKRLFNISALIVAGLCLYTPSSFSQTEENTEGEGNPIEEVHTHQFSETFTVIKEATCGEAGLQAKMCLVEGCDVYDEEEEIPASGDHSYGQTNIIQAQSCTENGLSQRVCSVCGNIQETVTSATGHIFEADEYTIDKEATCTEDGEKSIRCVNCSIKKEDSEVIIPALGHTWDEGVIQTAPTCTEEGIRLFTCGRCDATQTSAIDQLGHDFDTQFTIDVEMTCTQEGEQSHHCKREGCAERTDITPIPTPGHQYGESEMVAAPTCTMDGSERYTCTVCQVTRTEVIAAIGHDFEEEFTIDAEPKCIASGQKSKHCQHEGCTEKREVTPIAALGHDMVSQSIKVKPTCTLTGEEIFGCTRCTSSETRTIEPTGHDFSLEYTIDKKATCLESGLESRHCTHKNCEETIDERVIEQEAHVWGEEEVVKAPACTTEGKSSHKCSACGTIEEFSVDMLGHDYEEAFTVDVEATCEKIGSKSKHCSRCSSKIQTSFIPALGHTEGRSKRENIVEATCTDPGHYNDVVYCERCDKVISKVEKSIEPIGHQYEKSREYLRKPECESEGLLHSTCIHCGDVKTETVAALGHDYAENFTIDKKATCTELGVESRHCSRCDSKTDSKSIDALGHNWDKGSITTEPTCTASGILTKHCERCEIAQEIELDSLGHDFSKDLILDFESTCLKTGEKSKHCSRCEERSEIEYLPLIAHVPGVLEVADIHPATCTENGSFKEVIACQLCGTYLEETTQEGDPATGHQWDEGTVNVAPTCTEGGKNTFICTACGVVEIKDLAPLGHDYTDTFTVDIQATCTKEGQISKHCKRCDIHEHDSIIPMVAHTAGDPVKENIVDPKCTTVGSYDLAQYCTICKTELNRETMTVDSTGHTWNETIETKEPNCTENGVLAKTCKICMFTQTTVQKALGHDFGNLNVDVAPTCTTMGRGSKHCHRCDYRAEVTDIPALGHQMIDDTTKVPTCTEKGEILSTCEICGHTGLASMEPLGHDFTPNNVVVAQPSCESEGKSCKICQRCEEQKDIVTIPAFGHLLSEAVTIVKAPTCEESGISSKTCEICAKQIEHTTAPLGHKFNETYTVDQEPTCETEGVMTKHCERCEATTDEQAIAAIGHAWDIAQIALLPTDTTEGYKVRGCLHTGCASLDSITMERLVVLLPNEEGKFFDIKAEGYCHGEEEMVSYATNADAGTPYEFKVNFSEDAIKQGFQNADWSVTPTDERILLSIPDNCADGKYNAYITFRNADSIESPAIAIEFTVNISQNLTVAIFSDVVSIIKEDQRNYNTFQWYHNGEKLEEATLPYYQEVGGLTGSYFVVVNEGTADEFRTCARDDWHNPLNQTRVITIYPNPAPESTHLKLHNFAEGEHSLSIHNEYGSKLYETKFEGDEIQLPTGQLVGGQYMIEVDGVTAKMIKQ